MHKGDEKSNGRSYGTDLYDGFTASMEFIPVLSKVLSKVFLIIKGPLPEWNIAADEKKLPNDPLLVLKQT